MDELASRLRAEANRRAGEIKPAGDLPERIHARVARRRRQRRLRTGTLAAGALAAAIAVGVLTRTPHDGALDTANDPDHDAPTQSTVPSTTEPTRPARDRDTKVTRPRATGTTVPDPVSETETTGDPTGPQPSAPAPGPAPSSTTTTSPPDLRPPDSQQPAAGTCSEASQAAVEIVLNPDVPAPRCAKVGPGQTLSVRNATDQEVHVTFAGRSATIAPGGIGAFDQPFGDYLQPGVHRLTASLYGSSGAEIWLTP